MTEKSVDADIRPGGVESASNAVDQVAGGLPRGLLILLGLGSATLAVAGMKSASSLIAPVLLGVVLVITVSPVRARLERWGAPGWTAGLAIVVLVYAILLAMVVALVASVGQLAKIIPTYAPQFDALVKDAQTWLTGLGLQQSQINALKGSLDIGQLVGPLTDLLSGAVSVLTSLAFIATLVIFIGLDSGRFPKNLFASRGERPAFVEALTSFARGTRTYMLVSTVFGLIVAVIDMAALAWLGISGVIVWGVLSFVTNFIPNIGFVIGLAPPALIGLLQGGPQLMLTVIVLYSVINFVIQSVIQPKFQGDALGLSTTLTFLSLVFWAWVLGPLGAILALPLTLLTKALLVDVDPQARWLSPLLSGSPPLEPDLAPAQEEQPRVDDE